MNVLHIAWRELRSTFATTIGWLVLCGYLLVTGMMWTYMVENYVVQSQDLLYSPYAASQLKLDDFLIEPFVGNCTVVLLLILPAVTMRSFAEEFRQRTIELLLTSPVSTAEIVLGKYLGTMGFVVVLLGLSLHYPLALSQWGDPDPGVIGGAWLGMLLMSGMLVALGVMFSSLTSNQVVALVLSFAASFGLFLLMWGDPQPGTWLGRVSLFTHLQEMLSGALKLSDIAYFVLGTGFFLFATHQRLESFRWT